MKEKTEKKLTEDQRKALTRAFALRKEGRTWKEVANILKLDGFANQRKEPYTDICLRGWHSQLKGQIPTSEANHTANVDTLATTEQPVIVDKHNIVEETTTVETSVKPASVDAGDIGDIVDKGDIPETPPVYADTITREEVTHMITALEERLTNLVDAKFKGQVATSGRAVKGDKVDEPPLPPKTGPAGKRFLGKKGDIRVRADSVLTQLFESYAENHFGGNLSRAMDAVLWNFFDKPKLSFEGGSDDN